MYAFLHGVRHIAHRTGQGCNDKRIWVSENSINHLRADESVTKLHIYRSRDNGNCRASTVYDTKGLDRAATYRINSGHKEFYEERYSNYISYYGLCTYFNY